MDVTCSIPLGPLGPARLHLRDFLDGSAMDLIYPRRALDKYGRDMTAAAKNNKTAADPVIGRDSEIDRVVCTLCRRSKNNAVLVGAPGVGKTAIAEGLAQRVAAGTVPPCLAGARVVELDLAALLAGTKYRGTYEERVKEVIKEAERADDGSKVILFIDEIHTLLGSSSGGGGAAANMLKPALARGRIRCVGATTLDEYRRYMEKDAALERRFQRIDVEEPSEDVAVGILRVLKRRYEAHHGVKLWTRLLLLLCSLLLDISLVTSRLVDFFSFFFGQKARDSANFCL